jgi:hypothetical protein
MKRRATWRIGESGGYKECNRSRMRDRDGQISGDNCRSRTNGTDGHTCVTVGIGHEELTKRSQWGRDTPPFLVSRWHAGTIVHDVVVHVHEGLWLERSGEEGR